MRPLPRCAAWPALLEVAQIGHEGLQVAFGLRTRRLIIAIRSLEPGGGRLTRTFATRPPAARSAKTDDGITNGPRATDATLPSKIEISQAVVPTSSRKVVVRNRPRRTSASSSLTRAFSVSIISAASPTFAASRHATAASPPIASYVQGIGRAVNRLQPGAYQHQVGRAGRQQCDGQRDMHAFAGGLQGHSHGPQNIRRFYPGSLARYFCGDLGLVY